MQGTSLQPGAGLRLTLFCSKSVSCPSICLTPPESFIRMKFSALHRGNVKTLAVSSIAVASSIGSPSLNKDYPPRSDEQLRGLHTHPVTITTRNLGLAK